jgi:predicted component of type VI protein secretion system
MISRDHTRVELKSGQLILHNRSGNGTKVKRYKEPVRDSIVLRDRDLIVIGRTKIQVRTTDADDLLQRLGCSYLLILVVAILALLIASVQLAGAATLDLPPLPALSGQAGATTQSGSTTAARPLTYYVCILLRSTGTNMPDVLPDDDGSC